MPTRAKAAPKLGGLSPWGSPASCSPRRSAAFSKGLLRFIPLCLRPLAPHFSSLSFSVLMKFVMFVFALALTSDAYPHAECGRDQKLLANPPALLKRKKWAFSSFGERVRVACNCVGAKPKHSVMNLWHVMFRHPNLLTRNLDFSKQAEVLETGHRWPVNSRH